MTSGLRKRMIQGDPTLVSGTVGKSVLFYARKHCLNSLVLLSVEKE